MCSRCEIATNHCTGCGHNRCAWNQSTSKSQGSTISVCNDHQPNEGRSLRLVAAGIFTSMFWFPLMQLISLHVCALTGSWASTLWQQIYVIIIIFSFSYYWMDPTSRMSEKMGEQDMKPLHESHTNFQLHWQISSSWSEECVWSSHTNLYRHIIRAIKLWRHNVSKYMQRRCRLW